MASWASKKKKKEPQNFTSRFYINIWSCEKEADKHQPNVPRKAEGLKMELQSVLAVGDFGMLLAPSPPNTTRRLTASTQRVSVGL